ncbi:hypothetical protein [Flavobacterium cerinum]|uniref:DUF4034 domain-containing protein n=1 Tax=Flavobacterium cerinum TaxID=2502784 RepID=A0ABY5IWU7_9FLAO|nr:hypothetical protein [Flavobacterium cerinum]UUC45977.1 hypothetical protein NOX80_01950 [Flavobacterium cerinum]
MIPLNSLQTDLNRLYEGQDTKALKIEFNRKDSLLKQMHIFENGFWFLAPFAFDLASYKTLAVSLSPRMTSLKDEPVVKVYTGSYGDVAAVTQAPDVKAIIPMAYLKLMETATAIKALKSDLEAAISQSKPLFDYLGEGDLDFLKSYLSDEENQERFKKAKRNYDSFFCDFWNHYYDTPEHKKAFDLFAQLIDNKKFLPEFQEEDYGIWNAYVYSALTERADNLEPKNKVQMEKQYWHLWKYARMPLGVDCDSMPFKKYEYYTGQSKDMMWHVSLSINSARDHYGFLPDEVANHPLYEATTLIQDKQYAGDQHWIAAKRFDEEFNDPESCWNALVCTAYWAGLARRFDLVEASWQYAIDLSQRQGWNVLNEVLKDQWAFYEYHSNDRRTKMDSVKNLLDNFIKIEVEALRTNDTSLIGQLHAMTYLKWSFLPEFDFGWEEQATKNEQPIPRHLYKIVQYEHEHYGEIWACYLSAANPENGRKTLDDCFILAQIDGEHKLIARCITTDSKADRWTRASGNPDIGDYVRNTSITQQFFNKPTDTEWALNDFGDYEKIF